MAFPILMMSSTPGCFAWEPNSRLPDLLLASEAFGGRTHYDGTLHYPQWERLRCGYLLRKASKHQLNPACANNQDSPLYASGDSSYPILRLPNAPAAMILTAKAACGDDAEPVCSRHLFRFLRF